MLSFTHENSLSLSLLCFSLSLLCSFRCNLLFIYLQICGRSSLLEPYLVWSHRNCMCESKQNFENLHHSPTFIRQQAYLTFVRFQLEYASSIWSPHQYLKIKLNASEIVQPASSLKYNCISSITQTNRNIAFPNLDSSYSVTVLCAFLKHHYKSWSNRLSRLKFLRVLHVVFIIISASDAFSVPHCHSMILLCHMPSHFRTVFLMRLFHKETL